MRVDMQRTVLKVTNVLLRHVIRNMDYSGLGADPGGSPPTQERYQPGLAYRQLLSLPAVTNLPMAQITAAPSTEKLDLPTTAETVTELKRRLAKELYRAELDLQNGGRIAGKPCDCLSKAKHLAGIEATAEELMSYEKNPLYGEVIRWFNQHASEFEPAEIAKRPPEYYQGLTPEIRNFRKKVMGTDDIMALTKGG